VYDTITGKFLEYFHDFVQYLKIEIFVSNHPHFLKTCEALIFKLKKFEFFVYKNFVKNKNMDFKFHHLKNLPLENLQL